jgi:hypothetical protein
MSAETSYNQEILKTRYVDPVQNAVIKTNVLRNKIKFDSESKTGLEYTGAIMLRRPQGFTFAGGARRNTPFALNGAIAGTTKQITVTPYETILEEDIAYGFAASLQGEESAFNPELALIFESMVESHDQMYELNLLYGGTHIGVGNTSTGASPNGIHQISKASWSPHIWGPLEGIPLDAYSDSALTTKVTNGGFAVLTSVDSDLRTIAVTYATGADYTAANAAATGAGLYFTLPGAVGNVGLGVQPLITVSAAGGTVFGVNSSNYAYLRATSATISGSLTFTKIAQAATGPATKGGMGDLDVLLNVYSWTDVMNEQAALRQYVDENGGTFENGADELVYHGPNGGRLTVQCDPMLKSSEGLILGFDDWRSVGSTLPTFGIPGAGDDKFLMQLPRNAGFGVRRYSQTGTYCRRLARQCLMTGIVNLSGPPGAGT